MDEGAHYQVAMFVYFIPKNHPESELRSQHTSSHYSNAASDLVSRVSRCALIALLLPVTLLGCRASQATWIQRADAVLRFGNGHSIEVTPVAESRLQQLRSFASGPVAPGARTVRLLRNYNLDMRLKTHPDEVIGWLQELVLDSPSLEEVHALAEICKLRADWLMRVGDIDGAAGLYATAIVNADQFLFDTGLNAKRNAYDPHFRSICDVYNQSLAAILRTGCKEKALQPGSRWSIGDRSRSYEIEFEIVGRWRSQTFDHFELVNDFEISGIDNQYRTYGLGVPLIAVVGKDDVNSREGQYYPPTLTLPMTAFLEMVESSPGSQQRRAVVKLFDPLEQKLVEHRGVTVPLETDLTTPLAYHLNDPRLNPNLLATATLINGELADGIHGMYMLAPFDPNKIPVVLVHGIWSSPVTWAQMFNDLRAIPEIHENYQFWFYSYPTGQPFWISAQQMREDIAKLRRELDPGNDSPSLDQMVLIGHSMGGLVSQLQVIDSGNQFWDELVSDEPFSVLRGDRVALQRLQDTFFFEANDSIDRVVTIGTPNHGSATASATLRWIGQKLFNLPAFLKDDFLKLARQNPGILGDGELLSTTSVDALAEDNPIFGVLDRAHRSERVKFNNIIGQVKHRSLIGSRERLDDGDGVVSVESARSRFADSELIVDAEHAQIHQHPKCILEVRKILTQNLVEKNLIRQRRFPSVPATFEGPLQSTLE